MKFSFYTVAMLLIGLSAKSQMEWGVRSHLHIATDAEVAMASLQPGIGAQLFLNRRLGLVAEYYHFSGKSGITDPDCPVWGWQKHHTLALMGSVKLGRRPQKGMYAMAGLAMQIRRSGGDFMGHEWTDNRSYLAPAMELGYQWPVGTKGYGMAFSLKTTGPYGYTNTPTIQIDPNIETSTSSTLEILTQLSAGIVVDRRMGVRRR